MPVHRALADLELASDRAVGLAPRDQPDDLHLAPRQSARGAPRERLGPFDVRPCLQPLEHAPRRVELQRRRVVVAERTEREPELHAHARCVIRCVELLPHRPRVAEQCERAACVALGEQHLPHPQCGERLQEGGAESGRDRHELLGRRTRAVHVVHGQRDLDARGERLGACARALPLLEQTLHRRLGGSRLPLREPEQRESRLGRHAAHARLTVALLGVGEVTAQSLRFGQLVERRTDRVRERRGCLLLGRHASRRVRHPHARALRFRHRLRPRAGEADDLDPVHETLAAEGDELGLARAPLVERRRPLARTPHVEQLTTGGDHGAVHHAHRDRRRRADRHRDHRLVEQRAGFRRVADLGAELCSDQQREHSQLGIVEAIGECDRPLRTLDGDVAPTLLQRETRLEHEEQAALGAVVVRIVEQMPRACEPAARARELALEEEVEHDPEGEARRAHDVVRSQALLVRAHPQLAVHLVAAGEKGGGGEPLEIVDAERHDEVRGRELCVCLGPSPQRERAAPFPERLGSVHPCLLVLGHGRCRHVARSMESDAGSVREQAGPAVQGAAIFSAAMGRRVATT